MKKICGWRRVSRGPPGGQVGHTGASVMSWQADPLTSGLHGPKRPILSPVWFSEKAENHPDVHNTGTKSISDGASY